jgi:hypothetical protein
MFTFDLSSNQLTRLYYDQADPSTYRRPLNHPITSQPPPVPASHIVPIPDDLKTPKEFVQSKSQSMVVVTNKSFVGAGPSNTPKGTEASMPLSGTTSSSVYTKRRSSDDTDNHRPPPSLRRRSDAEEKPLLPHPPFPKKRPREVSMFIPKKRPDLKVSLKASMDQTLIHAPTSRQQLLVKETPRKETQSAGLPINTGVNFIAHLHTASLMPLYKIRIQ